MPKFDAKRGVASLKKGAKAMPKKVLKQMPNAAMMFGGTGVALRGGKMIKAAFGAIKRGRKPKAKNYSTDKMNSYWKRQELYRREGMRRSAKRTK